MIAQGRPRIIGAQYAAPVQPLHASGIETSTGRLVGDQCAVAPSIRQAARDVGEFLRARVAIVIEGAPARKNRTRYVESIYQLPTCHPWNDPTGDRIGED